MEDHTDPAWSVVIQKEPRSRRTENDNEESVIGASGLSTPVTFDDGQFRGIPDRPIHLNVGVPVNPEEVAAVDAGRERGGSDEPYEDMEHVDEDDDEDIEDPEDEGLAHIAASVIFDSQLF